MCTTTTRYFIVVADCCLLLICQLAVKAKANRPDGRHGANSPDGRQAAGQYALYREGWPWPVNIPATCHMMEKAATQHSPQKTRAASRYSLAPSTHTQGSPLPPTTSPLSSQPCASMPHGRSPPRPHASAAAAGAALVLRLFNLGPGHCLSFSACRAPYAIRISRSAGRSTTKRNCKLCCPTACQD